MTDIWESAPLVVEVWESQTTPGVVWTTVVRDGETVSGVQSIVAGSGVTVDATDPAHPVVSAAGGGAVDSVDGRTGVVTLDDLYASYARGVLAESAVQPGDIGWVESTGLIGDDHIPSSIARDTEVTAAVAAHDSSGTAHPDIRALIGGAPMFPVAPVVSDWIGTPQAVSFVNESGFVSNAANASTQIVLVPRYAPKQIKIDRLAVYIHTAGSTGCVLKVGIADVAAGTVSNENAVLADTPGRKEVAITPTWIDAGIFWLAIGLDMAGGSTPPKLRGLGTTWTPLTVTTDSNIAAAVMPEWRKPADADLSAVNDTTYTRNYALPIVWPNVSARIAEVAS